MSRLIQTFSSLSRRAFFTSGIRTAGPIYYTKNHEYIKLKAEGDTNARVGISAYGAEQIGELTFIGLDELEIDQDETLDQGDELCDVESVKAADTVKMPVSGIVLKINEDLVANALIANRSPEDQGWFAEIKLADVAELEGLLSKQEYDDFVQGLDSED